MKQCSKCGVAKEAAEFYADARRPDGLRSQCKACFPRTGGKRTPAQRAQYRRLHGLSPDLPYVTLAEKQIWALQRSAARAIGRFVRQLRKRPVNPYPAGSREWYRIASTDQLKAYRSGQRAKSKRLYAANGDIIPDKC